MNIFNEANRSFFENIWHHICLFFGWVGNQIEGILSALGIDFNAFIVGSYDKYLASVPTVFKILGLIFICILLVLGIIQFVKKAFKLFLVISIVLIIIIVINHFVN